MRLVVPLNEIRDPRELLCCSHHVKIQIEDADYEPESVLLPDTDWQTP